MQQETVTEVLAWLNGQYEAWQDALAHANDEVDKAQALIAEAKDKLSERIEQRDRARRMASSIEGAVYLLTNTHPASNE